MNEAQQQATNHLLGIMREAGEGNPRVMQLAMQWPSLAAALANLLLAHDLQPAPPLRRAAAVEADNRRGSVAWERDETGQEWSRG